MFGQKRRIKILNISINPFKNKIINYHLIVSQLEKRQSSKKQAGHASAIFIAIFCVLFVICKLKAIKFTSVRMIKMYKEGQIPMQLY